MKFFPLILQQCRNDVQRMFGRSNKPHFYHPLSWKISIGTNKPTEFGLSSIILKCHKIVVQCITILENFSDLRLNVLFQKSHWQIAPVLVLTRPTIWIPNIFAQNVSFTEYAILKNNESFQTTNNEDYAGSIYHSIQSHLSLKKILLNSISIVFEIMS